MAINKVLLVGITGVGKTGLAKSLAKQLQRPFRDPEADLVQEKQETVANLIRAHGQKRVATWLLHHTLLLLEGEAPCVIPCPPTATTVENFWEAAKARAHVIHLNALPMTLYHRVVEREYEESSLPLDDPRALLSAHHKQAFYHRIWLPSNRKIPLLSRLWLSADWQENLDALALKVRAMEGAAP